MTPYEIAGQIISIIAMGCTIFSYQQKKQKSLLICQLVGGTLFAISFFLLGAIIGAILNLVASVRALMFIFEEKTLTLRSRDINFKIADKLTVILEEVDLIRGKLRFSIA